MKLLKWSPFIFLGFVFIFLFWAWFDLWGINIVRDMRCGPSSSISKPMAEAIVEEINRRGTSEKIVKLDTLKNLPYTWVQCVKERLISKSLKEENSIPKQTCYFNVNNKKYMIRIEQRHSKFKWENNYIFIRKADILEVDFTAAVYSVSVSGETPVSRGHWDIFSDGKTYSKKSKGTCVYKSPLKF